MFFFFGFSTIYISTANIFILLEFSCSLKLTQICAFGVFKYKYDYVFKYIYFDRVFLVFSTN